MPGVNEAIAREFFEMHGFLVQQPHKYLVTARAKRPEEEIDLLLVSPHSDPAIEPPSGGKLLSGLDLRGVQRAVVSVRGWHTERVRASKLDVSPELVRFAQEPALKRARAWLGEGPLTRILCIPELPAASSARRMTLEALAEKGIDGVLLFPTMLRELIRAIDRNKNFEKSDLLQMLRILKIYGLLRDEQLELFRPRVRRPRASEDAAI